MESPESGQPESGQPDGVAGVSPGPSLSIVIPAFNEAADLGPTVDRVIRALAVSVADAEIIIVDDGSSDATGAVADELAAKHPHIRALHHPRNMGLGYGYARGVAVATKERFVYIPGDDTWPYHSLVALFRTMKCADIITAYSTNPEIRPAGRRSVSRLYTLILNMFFGLRMHYYNGLTIYPLAYLRAHPVKTYGFGFQAETLLRALNAGYSVVEVALPIDERAAGGSKAVTLSNILSVLATLGRLCWDLRIRPLLPVQDRGSRER
jgi:dolichol-phosphate mannosyltransferase